MAGEQVGRKENTRNCSLTIANNRDEDKNGDEDKDEDENKDEYKNEDGDDNEDDLQQAFFSSAPS